MMTAKIPKEVCSHGSPYLLYLSSLLVLACCLILDIEGRVKSIAPPQIHPHHHENLVSGVIPVSTYHHSYSGTNAYAVNSRPACSLYSNVSGIVKARGREDELEHSWHDDGGKNMIQFCLSDHEYPVSEIEHAIKYHYHAVASMYKDVILKTRLSVDGLSTHEQEHDFICPAVVQYAKPLRALNIHGEWKVIVNNIPANYDYLTQTIRLEVCKHKYRVPCPILPDCYPSLCTQKYTYHRLLVYSPREYYYPFKIDIFKFPSSCDCINGASSPLPYGDHTHHQPFSTGDINKDANNKKHHSFRDSKFDVAYNSVTHHDKFAFTDAGALSHGAGHDLPYSGGQYKKRSRTRSVRSDEFILRPTPISKSTIHTTGHKEISSEHFDRVVSSPSRLLPGHHKVPSYGGLILSDSNSHPNNVSPNIGESLLKIPAKYFRSSDH